MEHQQRWEQQNYPSEFPIDDVDSDYNIHRIRKKEYNKRMYNLQPKESLNRKSDDVNLFPRKFSSEKQVEDIIDSFGQKKDILKHRLLGTYEYAGEQKHISKSEQIDGQNLVNFESNQKEIPRGKRAYDSSFEFFAPNPRSVHQADDLVVKQSQNLKSGDNIISTQGGLSNNKYYQFDFETRTKQKSLNLSTHTPYLTISHNQQEKRHLLNKIQSLESQLRDSKEEKVEMMIKAEKKMKYFINEFETAFIQQQKEIQNLKEMNEKGSQNEKLRNELESQVVELKKQNVELKKQNSELKKVVEDKEKFISNLMREKSDLEDQCENQQVKRKLQSIENQHFEDNYFLPDSIQNKNEDNQKFSELSKQNDALQEEIKYLKANYKENDRIIKELIVSKENLLRKLEKSSSLSFLHNKKTFQSTSIHLDDNNSYSPNVNNGPNRSSMSPNQTTLSFYQSKNNLQQLYKSGVSKKVNNNNNFPSYSQLSLTFKEDSDDQNSSIKRIPLLTGYEESISTKDKDYTSSINEQSRNYNMNHNNLSQKLATINQDIDEKNREIVEWLKSYLDCQSFESIQTKVTQLFTESRQMKKFIECLNKLVIDCSPTDKYLNTPPKLKDSWKFIKDIMIKYMELKQRLK